MQTATDKPYDQYTLIRRMARAALEQAVVTNAGVPADFCVFPHADDVKLLWVTGPSEVRWMDDYNVTPRGIIYFDEDCVGVVQGDDAYRISESQSFYPDDYDLSTRLPYSLPFDITDIAAVEMDGWKSLPLAKIRRRPRVQMPKVHM
jgi:hypothetical protein